MTPRVIGLYSPAPQSGKTSVAAYLERHGYVRVSFAEPLKDMAIVFLRHSGLSKSEAKNAVYSNKTAIVPELGLTVRQLLQTLGTEWGRECLHPNVWTTIWLRRALETLAAGHKVVCDDVRRENEAAAIRSLEGHLWRITRPGIERTTSHASEGALDNYSGFDVHLANSGTLQDLYAHIDALNA